jgi:hypothetical protein
MRFEIHYDPEHARLPYVVRWYNGNVYLGCTVHKREKQAIKAVKKGYKVPRMIASGEAFAK